MTDSLRVMRNKVVALWRRGTTPKATDPDEAFRERTLRVLIIIHFFIALMLPVHAFVLQRSWSWAHNTEMLLILVISVFAVRRRKLQLAAWLLLLAGYWVGFGAFIRSQPWVLNLPSGHTFLIWAGALVLPPRSARWIPYITLALYTFVTLGQPPASPVPLDALNGRVGTILSMAVTIAIVWRGLQYLLAEFYRQRAELRSLINTLEDRVRTRTRNLEAAVEVSRQVTTQATLHSLLESITSVTCKAYALDQVAIYQYSDDTKSLTYSTSAGASTPEQVTHQPIDLDDTQTPLATALRERRITTLQTSEDIHVPGMPFGLPEVRSVLILPLVTRRDELLGVFVLASEIPDYFSVDEIRVFTLLSDNLANSMENARLYIAQLEANERLQSLDTLKSQFLAGVSHELQTPLNISLNFTEFVMQGLYGPINERQRDALEKAYGSQQQLQGEINALLELSRFEAGLISLDLTHEIDLAHELAAIGDVVHSLLKGKPVIFIEDIDSALPKVRGDRRRLHYIWLNLLGNAVKFTDSGSITLSVKKQMNGVLLAVIDTGPGIAPEDQPHIFERFKQTALGQLRGGTGLGLAITRALVEAHGGRISVESALGKGAAFYAFLPAADAPPESVPANKYGLQHGVLKQE